MRDNCLNIEEVKEIKNRIDFILNLMEHYGKEEIKLACNTYGVHGDYISIASRGFLEIPHEFTMNIEEGNYVNYAESENVDNRIFYSDLELDYPKTLASLGLFEEE